MHNYKKNYKKIEKKYKKQLKKFIKHDRPYDAEFLLKMLYIKINQMYEYFTCGSILISNDLNLQRDLEYKEHVSDVKETITRAKTIVDSLELKELHSEEVNALLLDELFDLIRKNILLWWD